MVADVHGKKGWYESYPDRENLDWLRKIYPQ
jgi:hypothetical protein